MIQPNKLIFSSLFLLLNFLVEAETRDSTSIDQKILKAYYMQMEDLDSSFLLAKEVLIDSKNLNYSKGIGSAYMRMGSIFNAQSENDSAIFYLRKAKRIRINTRDFKGAAGVCYIMNYAYQGLSLVDSSFYTLYKGLRLNEKIEDSIGLVKTYNNLGDLHSEYSSPKKAFDYYEKAKTLGGKLQYQQGLAISYNGVGNYYFIINDFENALKNFLLADSLFHYLNDVLNRAICANNIANCYDQMDDFKKSLFYHQKALKEYKNLGYEKGQASSLLNLGVLFENENQFDSAIYYYKEVIPLSKRIGDLNLRANAFEQLAKCFSVMNENQLAYRFQKKYSELKDTLINKDKISSISEMQTKYETEKKEQEIELLAEKNKTSLAERNALIAGSLGLILGLFVLLYAYYQRRKNALKDALIAEQKINVLLNEQELKAMNALIEGQEVERNRIATDLHDRMGSMLSTVKLLFGAVGEKIKNTSEETTNQYNKATALLDESCEEIRRVSHNLSTGMVSSLGLESAISELCSTINSSKVLHCKSSVYGLENRLEGNLEIGIYRIIQESVNNTLKHAKAKNISIQINCLEDELNVIIEDDGVGFSIEKIKKQGKGIGLHNLQARAQKLGGNYILDSKPGRGSTVIIEMPLKTENHG